MRFIEDEIESTNAVEFTDTMTGFRLVIMSAGYEDLSPYELRMYLSLLNMGDVAEQEHITSGGY